jgi:hypothetical protein
MVAVPLKEGLSAKEFRQAAAASSDANQARRLLALAAIRDGLSRQIAARIGGMDRQTLRDWVHAYNKYGLEGLINGTSPGVRARSGPASTSAFSAAFCFPNSSEPNRARRENVFEREQDVSDTYDEARAQGLAHVWTDELLAETQRGSLHDGTIMSAVVAFLRIVMCSAPMQRGAYPFAFGATC